MYEFEFTINLSPDGAKALYRLLHGAPRCLSCAYGCGCDCGGAADDCTCDGSGDR